MKILIADDNRFYRVALESTLTEWGYEVVAAVDGTQAWQILQEKDPPRLALVDWMMPGMDGLELCRKVRATTRAEPTYLLLLTAKEGKENIIAGLKAGADDYISKPFDREELHARLQAGLRIVGLQANLAERVKELEYALSGAQKLETIGRLAGGVAHDFNNLLTVILGGSDMLLGDPLLKGRQRDLVGMIRQSGERGASLTRQLLAFSRRQVLVPQVLQLNTLVSEMAKLLLCLLGDSVQLVTALEPLLGCIEADRGQIEQVLLNLAVNARDAMPQGGTLTITTRNVELHNSGGKGSVAKLGPHTLLAVTDTGCGMDDQVKAHLFEPFFTTKEPGKGTGLGLATVYGVIQQSGGWIEVASEVGRGTTFSIYLPRTGRVAPAPSPRPDLPRQGQETVLLVEDEEATRIMARTILQTNSYTVLEARDGGEALDLSGQWSGPIDLMVTDVVMPRLSGRQLADRLLPLRPTMKVLYMSGYTDDVTVHHSVLGTGKPFLQKPFTAAVLAGKVREVLDQ